MADDDVPGAGIPGSTRGLTAEGLRRLSHPRDRREGTERVCVLCGRVGWAGYRMAVLDAKQGLWDICTNRPACDSRRAAIKYAETLRP